MSRRDVMKSLLRSAATGAGEKLSQLGVTSALKRSLAGLASGRLFVNDSRLTGAAARVPGVIAATVSTRDSGMRVDLSFDEGAPLLMTLVPLDVTFATHGAKEWSIRVEPAGAALDPRANDVFVAIAGEVARTLWGPFLRPSTTPGHSAVAHREQDVLVLDLRTLPEVRAALGLRLHATGIDAFGLQAVAATEGGLRLVPRLPGLAL